MRSPGRAARTGSSYTPRLRRGLLHGVALAALLAPVGLAVPAQGASHDPIPAAAAARPDDDRAATATKALDDAEATLEGEAGIDPTLALVQVQQTMGALTGADRERADRLLARPDDPTSPAGEINYAGRKVSSHCTAHFCIHWVTKGKHAPDLTDGNDNDIPDYVDLAAKEMEHVWSREVDALGYRRPVGDGTDGNPQGVNRKGLVDVYLGNTGSNGVYGYAVPEDQTSTSTSYLVLDNDFAEFSGSSSAALKVTAAHEFFHAIQFAYSTTADGWLMESTATWVEEQVYDGINDNRQFLPHSTASRPGQPLDGPLTWYGNWVFFESLSQAHGAGVVRAAWQQVAGERNSMAAINRALAARGTNLPQAFSRFASGSNVPGRFFDEGKHYPRSRVARSHRLGPRHKGSGVRSVRLRHMSSRNYTFKPRSGARAGSRLRLRVATSSTRARARAIVVLQGGKLRHREIAFNAAGVGKVGLPFNPARVKRVVLTTTNASLRYRCFRGTSYTCQGKPRDDGLQIRYRAAFRL